MPTNRNPKTQAHMGRKIRDAREKRNMLQEEVANAAEISVTYYAGIERGEENPTVSVIETICKVLKIKSADILPF